MARFSFIKPLDQPLGNRRLLGDLKEALNDPRFDNFRLIVAYAKSGPLYRLESHLRNWRSAGKTAAAVIGIDQQGTSREALELALDLFDNVYITQEPGITFHPKIYLFKGSTAATAFVGSNNLTVGGTEKNFEAAIHIEIDLPAGAVELAQLEAAWDQLLPVSCPATTLLNAAGLKQLIANGLILDEKAMRISSGGGDGAVVPRGYRIAKSGLKIKPESPLPKKPASAVVATSTPTSTRRAPATTKASPIPVVPVSTGPVARGLAIQIKPHHNGEIFLSVSAALQNPAFFSWPFNGFTTPKKAGNPSYPQLDPDPLVNIDVFGASATPILTLNAYALNTVYYTKKSEIRITASPLVPVVPDYSIMILERSTDPTITYEITIYRPDSPEFAAWIAACNQTMPGGGSTPRRYGWF
jgi:HKD family nuclease